MGGNLRAPILKPLGESDYPNDLSVMVHGPWCPGDEAPGQRRVLPGVRVRRVRVHRRPLELELGRNWLPCADVSHNEAGPEIQSKCIKQ